MSAPRTYPRYLLADDGGAAMVEMSLIVMLLFLLTFGITDFANAMWRWNGAAKATAQGARLAAVSDPVWPVLATLTGLEGGALPGAPMPAFAATCAGATMACSDGSAADTATINAILARMQQTLPTLTAANVVVEYRSTGMGFAGRPGGPVPTITVRLTGLTHTFPVLGGLLDLQPIAMPDFHTTVTGEDLRTSAPA